MNHDYYFPPQMKDPFATALRDAVTYIDAKLQPIGIIGAGSVLRGEGDATSDLDLYVVFNGDYRQIEHKFFNDVPVQFFCNPPQRVSRYFVDERRQLNNGPTTAHMFASGIVILDRDLCIEQLRQEAREVLKLPPNPNPDMLQLMRYHAVSAVENTLDTIESDPDMAMLEICNALPKMLNYYFLKQGKYVPRHKDTLKCVREIDPELGQLIHDLFTVAMGERYAILEKIADKTLEQHRFFEYTWRDGDV